MLNVELMFSCVVGKMYTAHQCSERNKKMQLIILDVRLSSDFVSHKLQKKVTLSFVLSSCDQLL